MHLCSYLIIKFIRELEERLEEAELAGDNTAADDLCARLREVNLQAF